MKKVILIVLFLSVFTEIFALNYKKVLKNSKANKKFQAEEYERAEELHKENSIEYPEDAKIHFNLGNAFYKNQKYEEALIEFENSLKNAEANKSDILYNIGNIHFQNQDYPKALENYKNSLLHNPKNKDAKYNYELTKQFLQMQQEQDQQQNQDSEKDKKDQNKQEQKEQQSEKEKSEKSDSDRQDSQNQPEQQKKEGEEQEEQPQPTEEKIRQAERILDAMQRIEDENQKKMMKQILKQGKVKPVEKNW